MLAPSVAVSAAESSCVSTSGKHSSGGTKQPMSVQHCWLPFTSSASFIAWKVDMAPKLACRLDERKGCTSVMLACNGVVKCMLHAIDRVQIPKYLPSFQGKGRAEAPGGRVGGGAKPLHTAGHAVNTLDSTHNTLDSMCSLACRLQSLGVDQDNASSALLQHNKHISCKWSYFCTSDLPCFAAKCITKTSADCVNCRGVLQ